MVCDVLYILCFIKILEKFSDIIDYDMKIQLIETKNFHQFDFNLKDY